MLEAIAALAFVAALAGAVAHLLGHPREVRGAGSAPPSAREQRALMARRARRPSPRDPYLVSPATLVSARMPRVGRGQA